MVKKIAFLEYFLLAAILAAGLLVRLYKIDNPVADWHSWRQADTASVSRHYAQEGINLLLPRYDDRSTLASGKANPEGYRMVEFPLYNALHAQLSKTGWWNFDTSGRMLTVIISLLATVCLWGLVRQLSGKATALLAAFFMAMLPFSIYYSRVILPDQLMILFWLLGSWLFISAWQKPKPSQQAGFYLAAASFALGLLIRPYLGFFLLPLLWLVWLRDGQSALKNPRYWLFALIIVLPFFAWRSWISQYPEGIPAYGFLFNHSGLRFGPAWFRWLFGERLGWLILGGWGLIPLSLGLLAKPSRTENWWYQLWFLGVLAYFSVFAGGNVTHDYYQAITVPVLAALLAKGVSVAFTPNRSLIWPLTPLAITFAVALMLGLSWYQIREYYNINNWPIVRAGQAADAILPADAVVVAPYNADTAFLYQINRPGWPIIEGNDIRNMIDHRGITHYVSVNYDEATNKIIQESDYTVLEQTPEYVIVQLRYPAAK
jgi:uncharacterized membrane protein